MKKVNIFISSPGDVIPERNITKQVIKKLQLKLAARLQIEGFFWEDEPVVATATFQTQFPRAAHSDVFICLMWSRIGTPLPEGAVFEDGTPILRPDGSAYESGTIAEFEDAMMAYEHNHAPIIMMYFKTAEVKLSPDAPDYSQKLAQYEAVSRFFKKWFQDEQGRFPRGNIEFSTLTEFANKLETHLCKLLVERFLPQDSYSRKLCFSSWLANPYRGLDWFDTQHAPIFFGREQAIDHLYEQLHQCAKQQTAFVMLLGLSGSGKSSLVRAGLLPLFAQLQIPNQVFQPLAIGAPMLVTALQHTINTIDNNPQETTPQAILVIDQFEQIFTIDSVTEADRAAFVQILAETATRVDPQTGLPSIWILVTLRSELLYRCQEQPILAELMAHGGTYLLQPPTPSELQQIIEQPAVAAGLVFEHPVKQEPLNAVIFNEIADHAKNLALLQFTLQRLYEQREEECLTYAAYRAMGGITGALAQHAEMVFEQLSESAQAAFPRLVQTLISVDKNTGQPILGQRILNDREIADSTKELIVALIEARLLITDQAEQGKAVARLAHEALLQHWPRLRQWWMQNQTLLQTRVRVSDAASYWEAEGRPDTLLLQAGKPLADAQQLITQWPGAIMKMTREYIQNSQQQVEHQRQVEIAKTQYKLKRTRQLTGVLAVLSILAAMSGIYGYLGQTAAEQQAQLAREQTVVAEQARAEAEHQAQRAAVAAEKALKNQSLFLTRQVELELNQGNAASGVLLALAALPRNMKHPERPYLVEAESALYQALADLREQVVLHTHSHEVNQVLYRPDGQQILGITDDALAYVWSEQGTLLFTLQGHHYNIIEAAYSADSQTILTVAADRTLKHWSAQDGTLLRTIRLSDKALTHIDLSADSRFLLVVSEDDKHQMVLWDTQHDTPRYRFPPSPVTFSNIALSPDGQRLAVASEAFVIQLWQVGAEKPYAVLKGHRQPITQLAWDAQGRRLLSTAQDRSINVWEAEQGTLLYQLSANNQPLIYATLSPDGRWIAACTQDQKMIMWRADNGEEYGQWPLDGLIESLVFSPDSRYLIGGQTSSSNDNYALYVWDMANTNFAFLLGGHRGPVSSLALSPTKSHLASGSLDYTVRVWNAQAAQQTLTLDTEQYVLNRAYFSPQGDVFATAATDSTVQLWDADTYQRLHRLQGHQGSVNDFAFSPDGQLLATASSDNTARLWQVADGALVQAFDAHSYWVTGVRFSADGQFLLTAGWDGEIYLWSVATLQQQYQITHTAPLLTGEFSPDGRWVASSDREGEVLLWSVETGQVQHRWSLPYPVTTLQFSPDSQTLAMNQDADIVLWSVASGQQHAELSGHQQKVLRLAFSPNGQYLASAGSDHTVHIWSLPQATLHTMLTAHHSWVMDIAFASNSERLASVSWDGSAALWNVVAGGPPLALWQSQHEPLFDVAFKPDDLNIIAVGNDSTAYLWPVFPSTQAIIDYAEAMLPRELSATERKTFFLD